jgi:hypothetical protein
MLTYPIWQAVKILASSHQIAVDQIDFRQIQTFNCRPYGNLEPVEKRIWPSEIKEIYCGQRRLLAN